MVSSVGSSPLGQKSNYASAYDPKILFAIARAESREQLGLATVLPFFGCDVWTGYEVSWLDLKGKPQVAIGEFIVPYNSPSIIESKSFKLYLNSLNQTKFSDASHVQASIATDLSVAAGAPVGVALRSLHQSPLLLDCTYQAECLDDLDVEIDAFSPMPELLSVNKQVETTETLCSHLLKTNCPVTGQPDWASLFIEYTGPKIEREGLLKYVISFREHQDFHEHCVERMFIEIMEFCRPKKLSVYARYTRRGGLDINPFRSTDKNSLPPVGRLIRQ